MPPDLRARVLTVGALSTSSNSSACAVNTPLTLGQFPKLIELIGLCGQYAVDPGSVVQRAGGGFAARVSSVFGGWVWGLLFEGGEAVGVGDDGGNQAE
jgi:hypothetical protein